MATSTQIAMTAGTKLVAVGMETSKFGYALGPRTVGKRKVKVDSDF